MDNGADTDIAVGFRHLVLAMQKHNILRLGGKILIGVDRDTFCRLRYTPNAVRESREGGDAVSINGVLFGLIHEEP